MIDFVRSAYLGGEGLGILIAVVPAVVIREILVLSDLLVGIESIGGVG